MEIAKKRIKKYSGFEKRKFPFVYLFILFPVLQFLVFWVYVNFSSIAIAFLKDGTHELTFANMRLVIESLTKATSNSHGVRVLEAIKHSLFLWGLDFVILFPIGVTTTYILYRRIWGHYVFRVCYIIPSLMGAVMWVQLLSYMSSYDGIITVIARKCGVSIGEKEGLLANAKTAFPTIVGIKIVMGLVGNNAVLTGAFSRVPDEIYESADLDGAGFWRTFIQIAVPCVWSTIATLMTFSLCAFVTADYNVYLFTGGLADDSTATIGYLLYKITYEISNSSLGRKPYYGYPAALGVLLTVITVPIVLIGRKIIESIYTDVEI
ncbi:MAG: sugar ABC transporter permease [Clostridia bacterium]|nr:sugar ABC transporter permease [Clostridia bacterium]